MMRLSEAAFAMSAVWNGPDLSVSGINTDSRSTGKDQLFIALKGERFDGAAYVGQAQMSGAVAAVVEGADFKIGETITGDMPLLLVKNARRALADLALYWRGRFDIPLVAVTGSNGKTTVKEMLASILREACALDSQERTCVHATVGNLNNDIGVPLTLLNLRAHHRFAVIEIGMNHPGEIRYCTLVTKPDVALINNAQEAHLEGLGDVAAVARAKGEIFEGLPATGIAVINNDDPHCEMWRDMAQDKKVVTFALQNHADVTARYRLDEAGSEVDFNIPSGHAQTRLSVPGLHNVRNALAAVAAAFALEVPLPAIARGLAQFSGVKGRLAMKTGIKGATLIDDTYNANPASVAAAIAVLSAAPGRKILVLGDMGELGADAFELHRRIGRLAREARINRLYTLGDFSRHAAQEFGGGQHFEALEPLVTDLEELLNENVTVLVKGSRFMQMERVVQALEAKE
jgi:UDP-N-acetylmuramoyl-tripeptide--D-alanyl-D-alanine ligase